MLDQEDQRAIARQLRMVSAFTPDATLPERLSILVAKLLEVDTDRQASTSPAMEASGWPRARHDDCLLG